MVGQDRAFPTPVSYQQLAARFAEVMQQRDDALVVIASTIEHLQAAARLEDVGLLGRLVAVRDGNSPFACRPWSGSPDPGDPDNYWIDDVTGERVNASTGERSRSVG